MGIFFDLHTHSEYSIFDGMGKMLRRVTRAVELGYPSLALTDHGNTCGLVEHYKVCKEHGIKPILGVEGYYQPDRKHTSLSDTEVEELFKSYEIKIPKKDAKKVFTREEMVEKINKAQPRYHLCLFAKNIKGYENINKIQTEANINNFHYKPHITDELLEKYSEGVIISTACIGGYPAQLIVKGKEAKARKVLAKWKKIFADDVYIEIMPFSIDENETQEFVNRTLYDLGTELGIKKVVTTDSHFVYPDDIETHRVMFGMSGKDMGDTYVGRYMYSEREIVQVTKQMHSTMDVDQMLLNLQEISDKCNVELEFGDIFPKIDTEEKPRDIIRAIMTKELVRKGLWKQKYFDRLKYELEVIEELGYIDYFLVIHDIIKWCRENDIPTGIRGSAGNCMVTNALGLTDVDPVKLDNMFERFLRHGKKKMIDIDVDCGSRRRQDVVDYIEAKYPGKTAPISNYLTFQTKNLINDLAKYFEVPSEELAKVKEKLEKITEGRHRSELLTYKELKHDSTLVNFNNKHNNILIHFCKLWGQIKTISRHAGGIAITSDDITKYTALMKSKGVMQTVMDMESVDSMRILKLDILGVAHYDIIQDIEKRVGEQFSYDKIENPEIYSILCDEQTQGIFQLETQGATGKTLKVQPDCIDDIIAINSINRPGANTKDYIKGKHEGMDYTKPYSEYLKDSYGAIIYQEQVMMILKHFAGMEWDDIDKAIKILGKDTEDARKLKEKFMIGVKDKLSKSEAAELYGKMTKYLFNKGHASAYAIIGCWETYLKYNYPTEFYWSICKNNTKDDKLSYYMHHAICNNILFLKPHVNGSADYTLIEVEGEQLIQTGLRVLKGLGQGTAEVIEKLGPYTSKEDFLEKVEASPYKRKITSKIIEILDKAQAFEMDIGKFMRNSIEYNKFIKRKRVILK